MNNMIPITVTYPGGTKRIRYFYREFIKIGSFFNDRKVSDELFWESFQIEEVSGDLSECTVSLLSEKNISPTNEVTWYTEGGKVGSLKD